jgi:hypothetical protein
MAWVHHECEIILQEQKSAQSGGIHSESGTICCIGIRRTLCRTTRKYVQSYNPA